MNYNIDLVYLWCDSKDPVFIKKLKKYTQNKNLNVEQGGKERFRDNDELKYSLRSVEKYAPWIHHIFIVTDHQIPSWLNLKCPKVTVIDHRDIVPQNLLPCFNSVVIERYIINIPGLSEHFIYGNDDTFFARETKPNYFFNDEGKPILRARVFSGYPNKITQENINSVYSSASLWGKSIVNCCRLLMQHWHLNSIQPYELHHNFDSYRKSDLKRVIADYQEDLSNSISRFRSEKDINRILFSLESIYKGQAELKVLKKNSKIYKLKALLNRKMVESLYVRKKAIRLLFFLFLNTDLFCINDCSNSNRMDNLFEKIVLELLFPCKSNAER